MDTAKRNGKGSPAHLLIKRETRGTRHLLEGLRELLGLTYDLEIVRQRPATLVLALPSQGVAERLEHARESLIQLGIEETRLLRARGGAEECPGGGLVLSRRVNEQIITTTGIVLTVHKISGNRIWLRIQAPCEVGIFRAEIWEPDFGS